MSTNSIKLCQRFHLAMSAWLSLPELHPMSSLDESAGRVVGKKGIMDGRSVTSSYSDSSLMTHSIETRVPI